MNARLQSLEEIRRINVGFPYTEPVREWKAQGKKVIGWVCTYVPEEIIYAAGILPLRVTGDSKEVATDEGTAYLYANICSAMRSCLQLGLTKSYDFLDGFVSASTCDCSRRLHDVWSHYVPTPFSHILYVPRKVTERTHRIYLAEVSQFRESLEKFFGVELSTEALREAIGIFNKTRELIHRLYELRKEKAPPISGAETLEILNAAVKMPRNEFNGLLESLLAELSTRKAVEGRTRLMITGSILNNPNFIKSIEELGCIVVADELCTGTRHWWDSVDNNSQLDPLEAISRRYLAKSPCARMIPVESRVQRLLALAKDYRVDGIVTEIIQYCTPYAHDQPIIRERLEREGVSVLQLEVEYGTGGSGQIGTRVQAFLEVLERKVKR